MFSASEYFFGWLSYLIASVGLLVVWWRITSFIKFEIPRDIVRLVAAALLLIPFPVSDDSGMMAPAFMMSLLEAMFVREEGFSRAGVPVLIFTAIAIVVYLGLNVGVKKYLEKKKAQQVKETKEMSARDELLEESK